MSSRSESRTVVPSREEARQQLQSACRQRNLAHIRQLFSTTLLGGDDATQALADAIPHQELTRFLLEQRADPNSLTRLSAIRSLDIIKLLVEFGYDLALTGHLVLQ